VLSGEGCSAIAPLWACVSLLLGCRPGVQKCPNNRDVVVELLTPDVVASTGDMGNLELQHLLLHRCVHLRPNDRAAVKVGGDQERWSGNT
jgi:hypothetical protein